MDRKKHPSPGIRVFGIRVFGGIRVFAYRCLPLAALIVLRVADEENLMIGQDTLVDRAAHGNERLGFIYAHRCHWGEFVLARFLEEHEPPRSTEELYQAIEQALEEFAASTLDLQFHI